MPCGACKHDAVGNQSRSTLAARGEVVKHDNARACSQRRSPSRTSSPSVLIFIAWIVIDRAVGEVVTRSPTAAMLAQVHESLPTMLTFMVGRESTTLVAERVRRMCTETPAVCWIYRKHDLVIPLDTVRGFLMRRSVELWHRKRRRSPWARTATGWQRGSIHRRRTVR